MGVEHDMPDEAAHALVLVGHPLYGLRLECQHPTLDPEWVREDRDCWAMSWWDELCPEMIRDADGVWPVDGTPPWQVDVIWDPTVDRTWVVPHGWRP